VQNILFILLSVFLSSVGQIVLKYGAVKTESANHSLLISLINPTNIIGLALYGLSAVVWMLVLKRVELSYAYPMVSLGYVLVFIASYYLFGESLNFNRIIGLVLIMAGIFFVSRS
jgi:multidrug transporter EmrE-like cation transporter